jgi:hypothetical protein
MMNSDALSPQEELAKLMEEEKNLDEQIAQISHKEEEKTKELEQLDKDIIIAQKLLDEPEGLSQPEVSAQPEDVGVEEEPVVEISKEKKLEVERLAEEKKLEEEKLAEKARVAEEKKLGEERLAEGARLAEEKKLGEERLAEGARLAEEKKLEEERLAEGALLAEEKKLEEEKLAEEARAAEEKKLEAEKLAGEARAAEEKKLEAEKLAGEARAEEARVAELKKLEEEKSAKIAAKEAEAFDTLETIRKLVKENEMMKIDVFQSEALLLKAKLALDNKNFDEVKEYCAKAREQALALRKTVEGKDAEEFEAEFGELREIIMKAEEGGLNVEKEKSNFDIILNLKKEEKYVEALQKTIQLKGPLDRRLYDELHVVKIENIDKALTEMEKFIEETGMEFDDLNTYLVVATEALKEKDYQKLDTSLEKFYSGKEKHIARLSTEKYDRIIAEIIADAAQLKAVGLDVEFVGDLVGIAKESLSLSQTEAGEGYLDKARSLLNDLKGTQLKEIAKDHFSKAKKVFSLIKEAGIKADGEKEKLKETIAAFRKKDYLGAAILAQEVSEELTKLHETAKAREEELKQIEFIRTIKDELSELIEAAEARGLDASLVQDRIELCDYRIEEKKYDDAEKMLKKAKEELNHLMESDEKGSLFKTKFAQLPELMDELKNNGLDVNEEEGEIEEILEFESDAKFDIGMDRIGELKESILNRIKVDLYKPRDRKMKESIKLLKIHKEEVGEGFEELQELLIKAREALEKKKYRDADDLLERFSEKKRVLREEFELVEYGRRLEHLSSEISLISELDIDVSACEDLVMLAKKTLDRGEVSDHLEKMVVNAEKLFKDIKTKELFNKAREYVYKVKTQIDDIKKEGGEVANEVKMLKQAMASMVKKDYIGTCKLGQSIKANLVKLEAELSTKRLTAEQEKEKAKVLDILEAAEETMAEARGIGLDVGLNADRLEIARSRFEEGKFEDASELALTARKDIQEIIERKKIEKVDRVEKVEEPVNKLGSVDEIDELLPVTDEPTERNCPRCRRTVRGYGKRCVHCGALMEKPEKKKIRICEICNGGLVPEDDIFVCLDCGAEYEQDGSLIVPDEAPGISELLEQERAAAAAEEERERERQRRQEREQERRILEEEERQIEEEEAKQVSDSLCELCGVELEVEGDLLVCPLCGVEYTPDGEVSVSKGEKGENECELCGGALERKGKGMVCTVCEAEYDASGNFATLADEEAYGEAIEKMISTLEVDPDKKKASTKGKAKVVRKAVKRVADSKKAAALKKTPGKITPPKKKPFVKKAVAKKVPIGKPSGKKLGLAKKQPAKKVIVKKKGKGPSWDQLKAAKAKKKKGKGKKKKLEYDNPPALSFLKKK